MHCVLISKLLFQIRTPSGTLRMQPQRRQVGRTSSSRPLFSWEVGIFLEAWIINLSPSLQRRIISTFVYYPKWLFARVFSGSGCSVGFATGDRRVMGGMVGIIVEFFCASELAECWTSKFHPMQLDERSILSYFLGLSSVCGTFYTGKRAKKYRFP